MPSAAAVLALNLRAERARRRLTQTQMAALMEGWSTSMVSEAETGQRKMSIDDIAAWCLALGVPLAKLLEGADPVVTDALGI